MSNNKQSSNHVPDVGKKVSSVEWLMQQIALKHGAFQAIAFYEENFKEFQQAKEMHNEEVKNAYISGYLDNGYYEGAEEDASKLWEDTYGFAYNSISGGNDEQQ